MHGSYQPNRLDKDNNTIVHLPPGTTTEIVYEDICCALVKKVISLHTKIVSFLTSSAHTAIIKEVIMPYDAASMNAPSCFSELLH